MTVIDDAPLIADRISIGDLAPEPEHAKVLAEYVRESGIDQLREDRNFWRSEARTFESSSAAADAKAEALQAELDKAKARIKTLSDAVAEIYRHHDLVDEILIGVCK